MIVALAGLLVVLTLLSPLVTLYALNALGVAIPLTFGTYCAVAWLQFVLAYRSSK